MKSGTVLAGRYRLDRPLGQGGMGQVWHGRDLMLNREVAIKIMLHADDPTQLRRFQREAAIAAGLQHPGITVVHDSGVHLDRPFIVMEMLTGRNLGQILAEQPSGLPVGRALDLAIQAGDALRAAHDDGIVHRDLKPANLLVQSGDRLKICDFGIAKDTTASSTVTMPGQLVGTPAYMAPEHWHGQSQDPRSDLYALGCVLYTLLTGHPPFPEKQPWAVLMRQHAEEPPPRLRDRNSAVPRSLEDLALALLAKKPSDRPPSAAVVAERLRRIRRELQEGQSPQAPSAPPRRRGRHAKPEQQPPGPQPAAAPRGKQPDSGSGFDKAKPYIDKARELISAGRDEEAEGFCRQAVRFAPDSATAQFALAACLQNLGHYREAEMAGRRAVRLRPAMVELHVGLADTLRRLERYPEAEKACRDAIRLDPSHAEGHYQLGKIAQAANDYPAAVAAFREAIRLDPRDVRKYTSLARVLLVGENLADAELVVREGIKLAPSSGYAHLLLAAICFRQDRLGEAADAYHEGRRLDPSNVLVEAFRFLDAGR